jgi:hypothetical protein
MHWANASAARFWAAVSVRGWPRFGKYDLHACRAALNAGDCGSSPVPVRSMPPLVLGSGKVGTPWERMHLDSFSAGLGPAGLLFALFVTVPLGAPMDPHAASATQHPATLTAVRARDVLMARTFYAAARNRAVTVLCRRYAAVVSQIR